MDLSRSDRCRMAVKWIAEQKKIPMSQVGEMIGYNNASSFSQVLNSKRDVPSTFPDRIASLDPRINVAFLLGESDDMLLPGNAQPDAEELARPQRIARPPGIHLRGQGCRNLCHTISVSCGTKVGIFCQPGVNLIKKRALTSRSDTLTHARTIMARTRKDRHFS